MLSRIINGIELDKEQESIVTDNSDYMLVVAGAGSGKSLCILGKIEYLTREQNIKPDEILCISFTRASAYNIEEKATVEGVSVYTFHRLALKMLKDVGYEISICEETLLNQIIHEFLTEDAFSSNRIMESILRFNDIKVINNTEKTYKKFLTNQKKVEMFEKLISTFLHLFKCNGYNLDDFNKFLIKIERTFSYKKYAKEKSFLIVSLNIYIKYQKYLQKNNEVDFDDMIIEAQTVVKKSGVSYKYIIIDEYQDTSYIRFNLIREIVEVCGAKLMVVGDDFQSIYRFTGCDIDLFLNFKKYFPNATIKKIQKTYRNSDELIKMAGFFVMKNKRQVTKKLVSSKNIDNAIVIVYYKNIRKEFKSILETIYKENKNTIMVLGRNNSDVNKIIDEEIVYQDGTIMYINIPELEIQYYTVHKSKGLEADNVIIINMEDKLLGFPNQIKDEKILRLVSMSYDNYPFSEERRLFYVALTRTRNKVYLLTPTKKPSIFIGEIKEIKKKFSTCSKNDT